jgi:hypothetical protein
MTSKIAIIGTAGRDKTKPMTARLWAWMVLDALQRVPKGAHLVSGGAAWADHLAVDLYLRGHAADLTLHLPAPFMEHTLGWQFVGGFGTAGGAANYYHRKFSQVVGYGTLAQIADVLQVGASCTEEPMSQGYAGMFNRNAKVAQADIMLAYTFGEGNEPADGGTKNTWDACRGQRTHITLPLLP